MTDLCRTCSYCKYTQPREYTTNVPKTGKVRDEWIRELGEEFEKNCKKDPKICLQHFAVVKNGRRARNAKPKRLPFWNVNLGNKVRRRRLVLEEENPAGEVENEERAESCAEDESLADIEESGENLLNPVDVNVEEPEEEEGEILLQANREELVEDEDQNRQIEDPVEEEMENVVEVELEARIADRIGEIQEANNRTIPIVVCYICAEVKDDATPNLPSLVRSYFCDRCRFI